MENKSIPEPSILFVDDEEIIRKSLIRELQMECFAVTAAAGGSEAVAALKESQYDLVITDLMMPGVDGFSVLKAAKKIAPLTSVIILTNNDVMQYAIAALRQGADDIASKPCDIDELVSRIRHCLEKRNLLLEREQPIKALRESEERDRSIVNASPDCIIIADMEGQILMVSPAGVSMFGYDPDDKCQGHWVSEFIAPWDRRRALSNIVSKVQNVKTGPNEYLGLRKDGSTFDIEVNNDFIRSADGQLIRIVFIVRDISERKRVEVALHESQIFNLAILNSLPAEIAVLEPDGVIIAVNDSRRFTFETAAVGPRGYHGRGVPHRDHETGLDDARTV